MRKYKYTRITIFNVMHWIGLAGGLVLGGMYFGTSGAIIGGLVGFVLGYFVSLTLEDLADRAFFKEIDQSSNSKLWEIVGENEWNLRQSIALLSLGARGEDVQPVLPRIISMLESDSTLTRRYGWDALRLVYNEETNAIGDYNPRESVEECRRKVARLRAM